MSAAESRMSTVPVDSTDGRFLPVQVSLSEAIAQADMILCRELVGLGRKVSEAELELQPEEVGLFYVPFHLENYFYVDSALNAVSLEKTLLE